MAWTELGLGADNRYYYRNGEQWASTGSPIPAGSDGVISDSEVPGSATRGSGVGTMPEGSWPEVAGWTRTIDASTHRATYSREGVTRSFGPGEQGNVHSDLATHVPPPVSAAPGAGDPGSMPYVNPYASASGEASSPFGAALAARVPGANEAMVRDLIPRRTGESESAYQARIMGMSPTAVRDELATADASRWLTFYRDQGIPPDVAYRDLAARGVLAPGLTPPAAGSAGWPNHGTVRPWHPSGNEREALPHTGSGVDAHTTREPYDIAASQGALGPRTGTPPPGTMRAAFAAPAMAGAAHRADRIATVRANTERTMLTNGWMTHATRPTSEGGLGWTREQAVGALSNTEPPLLVNGRPNPNMSPSDMASRLYTRPEGTAYDPNNPTAGTPISPTYVPRGGGAARPVPGSGTPPDYDPAHPPGALAMGMIRHLTRMLPLSAPAVPGVVAAPGGSPGAPGGGTVGGPGGAGGLPPDAAAIAGGDPAAAAAYNNGLAAWDATHPGGVGGSGGGTAGGPPPPPVGPAVPGAVTVGGPVGGATTTGAVGAASGPPAPAAEMDRAVADLNRYGITDPADIAAFRAAYGNASTETLRTVVPPLGAGETPTAARSAEVRRGLVDGMVHQSGSRLKARFGTGQMDDATADALAAQMYREGSPAVNPDSDPPPSLASVWGAHTAVDARIDGLQPQPPATTLSRSDPSVAPIMASATSYYRDAATARLDPTFAAANPAHYGGTAAARRTRRATDTNLYLVHNGVYDSPAGLRSIARTPRPAAGGTDPLAGGVTSFTTTLGTGTGASASPLRRGLEERLGRVTPGSVDTTGWTQQQRQTFEVERWRRGNTVEDRIAGENMQREGWAHQTRERLASERHAMGMAFLNQHFTEKNTRQQFVNNLTSQFANAGMQLMQSQIQMMNQLTLQQLQAMYQVNAQLLAQGTPKPFDIVMGMLQGGRR